MINSKTKVPFIAAIFVGVIAALLMFCAPSNAWAAQEAEPNDELSKPNTATLGNDMFGMISQTDTDCFVFNVPENGTYNLTFTNDDYGTESGNFGIQAYDMYYKSLRQMIGKPNSTEPVSASFNLSRGKFYVKIYWSWWFGKTDKEHQYRIKLTPVINTTTIQKVTPGKKSATVKFKKKIGTTKYEVRYSLKSNMKSAKTKVLSASKSSVKITKLKKSKKYYFQVRVMKTMAGKNFYSSWSPKRYVKITR